MFLPEDYWKWQIPHKEANAGREQGNLLVIASKAGSPESVMMAVDVFGIPVTSSDSPIIRAAERHSIETLAVLFYLQAEESAHPSIIGPKAVGGAMWYAEHAIMHYMLFCGADITATDKESEDPQSPWSVLCALYLWHLSNWRFQEVEGMLFHCLLHNVTDMTRIHDGSSLITTDEMDERRRLVQSFPLGMLNGLDAVRLWALCGFRASSSDRWDRQQHVRRYLANDLTDVNPDILIDWSLRGLVTKQGSWPVPPGQYPYQYLDERDNSLAPFQDTPEPRY